ncbi:4399_t:CDS:10 [Entrophospora sp. SA101]|nr:4399_t:CDS:10 [Entrophospora sp. SA101]
MSLNKLRDEVLSNQAGEERVEINQRHLIDKILARYSNEFVVYRELLQNSDDAKATNIEIIFETKKPKNVSMSDKCVRILFKNNGFLFRPEDWNRLKKIAEGNPDEQKIGAFGVGFYSLFSVCDDPFVSSGTQAMAFYWRGDQLFFKRKDIKQNDNIWTTFLMDTIENGKKLPEIEVFGRFLVTSLGFTGNLNKITVYFDNIQVIQLTKKMDVPRPMSIKHGIKKNSPNNLFELKSVNVYKAQLDVNILITSTKSPIKNFLSGKSTIFLKIASGNVDLKIPEPFRVEMERATKKWPPKNTKIQMIFTSYDEQCSSDQNKYISNVFRDLLAFPEQGKIFIGFPTFQTTGCSAHLAARLIPTVIDLAHKTLAKYNEGMLSLAGTLSRIIYEDELIQISKLYKSLFGSKPATFQKKSEFEDFQKRVAHVLAHFTFKQSTPRNEISTISESQFFNCISTPLPILSTHGILPIESIRIPTPETVLFIKSIPIVPPLLLNKCCEFFKKAKDTLKLMSEISINDIFKELEGRALDEDEIISLLKWWIGYEPKNLAETEKLMKLATIQVKKTKVPLSNISYYLDPTVIPLDVEVPLNVLPYSISKCFDKKDIETYFSGWSKLNLITWIQFITTKPSFEQDPAFSEEILRIISRQSGHDFEFVSEQDQATIKQLLANKECIPTSVGMNKPSQSYFPGVDLFTDLPIVCFRYKISDKFLAFLGVRKHIEPQLLFDRLISQGSWDHMQLIEYLIKNEITDAEEIKKLSSMPIWPIESNNKNSKESKIKRFTAKELYAPLSQLRELGLPIIQWNGEWNKDLKEVKFISSLDLRKYPPLDVILQLASSNTELSIRQKALCYFIENFKARYYKDYNANMVNLAFLPCTDTNVYATPTNCYTNPECEIMKFNILNKELLPNADEFGVKKDPCRLQILVKLREERPENEEKAKLIFDYLSSFHFIHSDWAELQKIPFIPIRDKVYRHSLKHVTPLDCFFNGSYDHFNYINFGEKANMFLRNCGVKNEPSPTDLAEFLIKYSHEFLKSLDGNVDKYIDTLHKISFSFEEIKGNSKVLNDLKECQVLLAVKKENNSGKKEEKSVDDDNDSILNDLKECQALLEDDSSKEEKKPIDDKDEALNDWKGYQALLEDGSGKKEKNPVDDDYSISILNDLKEGQVLLEDDSDKKEEKTVGDEKYVLASSKDIYINDEEIYYKIFKPLSCPVDNLLEDLYKKLGCLSLSNSVTSKHSIKGKPRNTQKSIELQILIRERALLFYHDIKDDDINRNQQWLKALKVMEVDQIKTTYVLAPKNITKVINSDTSCILEKPRYKWKLFIRVEGEEELVNFFSIAKSISQFIYKIPRFEKFALLDMLLTKSIADLKDRGFPVDRLVKQNKITVEIEDDDDACCCFGKPRKSEKTISLLKPPQFEINSWYKRYNKPCTPMSTEDLKKALHSGINLCCSNSDPKSNGQTTFLKSQISYCDIIPGHSLKFIEKINEIEFYISRHLDSSVLLSPRTPLINFIQILEHLSEVFELPSNKIHVFYDPGVSVAFNRNNSLFFNFNYYLTSYSETSPFSTDIMAYWFTKFCHELAHNIVIPHGVQHESTEDQGYDIKKLYELRVFCAIVQYDLAATALTASFWFKSWTL